MRKPCPAEEMLADYIEGRLAEDDRAEMEAHLSDCEICLEEFMVGERLFRDGEALDLKSAPDEVTQAAVRLAARQLPLASFPLSERLKRSIKGFYANLSDIIRPVPWGRLALVPIRGSKIVVSSDIVQIRKIFKGIETQIEIEKTAEGRAKIRVELPEARNRHRKGIRVTLKRGKREIYSHLIDGGYVLFEDIPFGHYGLSFSRDGVELGTYLFEMKESQHDRK
jgi:hypothetical protein